MRYFPEIIRILDRFRERRIETVDTKFREHKQSKEFQLYDGIRSGIFNNDSEAADALYDSLPTATKYSSLKNRLKVRLLNSLFHLNWKKAGFSESAQAYYLCRKRAFMVHILIALGARRVAARLAETTFELATRFGYTEVALAMIRELRQNASAVGKISDFEHYDQLLTKIFRSYEEELISAGYIERIVMIFNRQMGGRAKFAEEFARYEAELRKLLSENSTYNFRLNYYRVLVRARSAAGQHREIIAAARDGIKFLQEYPHLLQKERLADFWYYQLQSFLMVKNYEQAFQAATECAKLYNVGSNSWFSFRESFFLLLMNTLKFKEAEEVLQESVSHTRYVQLPEAAQEHWEIFKYYLNFALKSQAVSRAPEVLRRFNIDALMRMVPVARRDKHGLNVAILIAQVLQMLETRNYNGVMDRMEALGTYRSRYLQASMTQASSLFFKLLRIMENNSFNYKLARDKGRRFYNQLCNEHFEIVDVEQELQVLPYEWLWERVLDKLKEQERG